MHASLDRETLIALLRHNWWIALPALLAIVALQSSIPLKYNIRYLMTRWVSTAMTALTFGLVIAVFIVVMSLVQGLERALVSTGDPLNVIILRPGVQSEGQSQVQIDRFQILRTLPGIAKDESGEPLIAPEVIVLVNKAKRGPSPDKPGEPTNLQIRGVHPIGVKLRPMLKIVEGKMFTPGLRELVVSNSVRNRFHGMGLGEKVHLGKGEWTVVGIFDADRTAFDSEMWTDYQELMAEFDRGAYSVALAHATDAVAAKELMKLVDEQVRLKLDAKTEDQYYAEQTRSALAIKAFGYFLALVMAIGACFAGMNTMYGNVANRMREIGTLRVLGYTPFSIMFCFLIESIALALLGGALGCGLSLVMNGKATGTTNFQSFSELVFYFTITPRLMGIGLMFAMIMGVVGGFLPAVFAARQPIIKTLKQV